MMDALSFFNLKRLKRICQIGFCYLVFTPHSITAQENTWFKLGLSYGIAADKTKCGILDIGVEVKMTEHLSIVGYLEQLGSKVPTEQTFTNNIGMKGFTQDKIFITKGTGLYTELRYYPKSNLNAAFALNGFFVSVGVGFDELSLAKYKVSSTIPYQFEGIQKGNFSVVTPSFSIGHAFGSSREPTMELIAGARMIKNMVFYQISLKINGQGKKE